MMNRYATTGRDSSEGPPQGLAASRLFKYAAPMFLFLVLVCPSVQGDSSIINRTGYGSYGIITRIQSSSKRVIFQPMDGAFNEGLEVSYYDSKGQVICKGKIQSIYKDEIYTKADDCDKFDTLGPGMGVAFNGDVSDMLEVYRNKAKLEAAIIDREWNRFPGVPRDIDEEQYGKMVLKSSVPILVEFYSTWCPYCQETVPVLGEIAKDLEGRVRVATLDREKNAKLWLEMKQDGVPAFYIVKDSKVIARWTGAIRDKPNVLNYIKSTLKLK